MGSQPKAERKVPIRRVATAMLAVAVMIGGIGVTESAALWRRLATDAFTTSVNDVRVCRDGLVVDVAVFTLGSDGAYTIPTQSFPIQVASGFEGGLPAPGEEVAFRGLTSGDLEFRYLAWDQLPAEVQALYQTFAAPGSTRLEYFFGRVVVPFTEQQGVGAELYLNTDGETEPQLIGDSDGDGVIGPGEGVGDCSIWLDSIGSFFSQFFNWIARIFNLGNQGVTALPAAGA